MPGDSKLAHKKIRSKEGIPISHELFAELKETGEKYGVDIGDFLRI